MIYIKYKTHKKLSYQIYSTICQKISKIEKNVENNRKSIKLKLYKIKL